MGLLPDTYTAGCACAGNAGNISPRRWLQRKPLVSDSDMHHGTCVTHVPWGMSGSLNRGGGENVPGIPGACAPAILRIWEEAHRPSLPPLVFHLITFIFWYLNQTGGHQGETHSPTNRFHAHLLASVLWVYESISSHPPLFNQRIQLSICIIVCSSRWVVYHWYCIQ